MQPIRTFIALDVATAVAARIGRLIAEAQTRTAGVKWVDEKSLHLTLQFLGDVDPPLIPEIGAAVEQAASEVDPFEMTCRGLGAFPNLERPRTLWIGIDRGAEEMCDLQQRIERELKQLGFRPEARKFQPHLTIGRVKRILPGELTDFLQGQQEFAPGATHVAEAVVYSSQLERAGPQYTVLARAVLGGD